MFRIDDGVLCATIDHLRSSLPSEGIGLWSGHSEWVSDFRPLRNTSSRPQDGFEVHPQDWIDALQEAEQKGLKPIALVHSHPTAPAVPSARDRAEWHYPDLYCAIFSFAEPEVNWQLHTL